MRVDVRGTIYQTVKEAASALGVSTDTVYCALSRRTTDTLGLGKGNRSPRRYSPKNPVTIGPYHYPSQAELARAIGWKPRRVQQTLRIGKTRARQALLEAVMRHEAQAIRDRQKKQD